MVPRADVSEVRAATSNRRQRGPGRTCRADGVELRAEPRVGHCLTVDEGEDRPGDEGAQDRLQARALREPDESGEQQLVRYPLGLERWGIEGASSRGASG